MARLTMILLALVGCSFTGCEDDAAHDGVTEQASDVTIDGTDVSSVPADDGEPTSDEVDTGPAYDTDEIWVDAATGLGWQKRVSDTMTWADGIAYCDALALDGRDDWHLPTISELRSIVTGCDKLAGCGITDECAGYNSCGGYLKTCEGCPLKQGSVMPPALDDDEQTYWSATEEEITKEKNAWIIRFTSGKIEYVDKGWDVFAVRCARAVGN